MVQGNLHHDCKEHALDAYPKTIQQLNFIENLDPGFNFLDYCTSQKNYFEFLIRNCKSILNSLCKFIWYWSRMIRYDNVNVTFSASLQNILRSVIN